ncbi:MAG: 4-hydroxy-3-methylbut-2-enyl diphosphate reductase [Candidatus Omnitrophica bacterium]|nr:4-hydroxy-3-methylbut-2-enyl diphosphate reductase [Candidatus Omnitrophota bacterium]
MVSITIATHTGFCSGVKRAVQLVQQSLSAHKGRVYSLGPVIHNHRVMEILKKNKLHLVSSINNIKPGSTLILPSHGSSRHTESKARQMSLRLVNTMCPYVSLVQKICATLNRDGLQVLIVGDRAHPEIKALLDIAPSARVITSIKEIKEDAFSGKRIGIISQTTQSREFFINVVNTILKKNKKVSEAHIFNTICLDTSRRQEEVKGLAGLVDVLLVIGSKTSANTKRLLVIGQAINKNSYLIESEHSRFPTVIKRARRVGVISGASTPSWLVEKVVEKIKKYGGSRK